MYQYNKIWHSTEPKTSSGKRVIPLTKEGRKILETQKEVLKKIKVIPIEFRDFVFLNSKGKPRPRNAYDKVITRICKQNNLRHFSSHTLRHTFATRCLEAGMKPKTLQVILGHSNIALTMNTYVHITEDEKKKEVQLFENFFEMMVQ
jgi:integrase